MKMMIKSDYVERQSVPYFVDDISDDRYQWDTYRQARRIVDALRIRTVLDLGCGDGRKLVEFFGHLNTIGCDIGVNLQRARKEYPRHEWIEFDLTSDEPLLTSDWEPRLIICADVIEHLPNIEPLLAIFRATLNIDSVLVVSTPDRELYGAAPDGPPANGHHIREWTVREFSAFMRRQGFRYGSVGLEAGSQRDRRIYSITAAYAGSEPLLGRIEPILCQVEMDQ
jgi:2-polyprenyl-3-methyl-5-hydroxy-6-metoxy-1,4-benzoquinol methylase